MAVGHNVNRRAFGEAHAGTADSPFNDAGDAGDFFDKTAFDSNGLFFQLFFSGQMTENTEAGSADHLCCPRKDGSA